MRDRWHQNAVIYCVETDVFRDGNDDFVGLTQGLAYLAGLGDFALFMDEANSRGIRVLIDLVVNHTSDEHPWFRAARREGLGSKHWDHYVWSEHPPADTRSEVVFPGKQDGDRLHLMLNFWVNPHLFLVFARGQAEPIRRSIEALPELPTGTAWAFLLRNHDELDLSKLTDGERAECLVAFAPNENMRLYGRGFRRRPAPMFGHDPDRLLLAYSLLFSLPGSPVIWYGEELGMGDGLALEERNSARTPMRWNAEPNADFSRRRNTAGCA